MGSLEPELQRLIDKTEIRELTARYNRATDDGAAEVWAATFTPDGALEVVGGPSVKGTADLVEFCGRTPPGIVHVTVDPTIDIQGDHAVQDVTILVLQRPAADASPDERHTRLNLSGRYRDELIRTSEGWRFTRRTATLQ